MIIGILTRRLREGKTYEDFREAWLPDKGFGVPTRVVSGQGLEDAREIVTIGFTDIAPEDVEGFLARVGDQESVRHDRIDEVIEPAMARAFYVQVSDDDLTEAPDADPLRLPAGGAGQARSGNRPPRSSSGRKRPNAGRKRPLD